MPASVAHQLRLDGPGDRGWPSARVLLTRAGAMSSSPCAILVVDDDRDIRETLTELLCDEGHPATNARDGFDALEKLEQVRRPCLILLDLMMPRMSGLELLERLATHPVGADFVVVVMSGQDALRRQAQKYTNVFATVPKPFEFDELLSLINGATAAVSSPNSDCESNEQQRAPSRTPEARPPGASLPT